MDEGKGKKIIIALDVDRLKEEERLVRMLSPYVDIFKIGMELFYSCGPKALDIVKRYERDVFLDLKFHDIPNTVKGASMAAVRMSVRMFNVHVQGGVEMMKAALEGAEEESERLGVSRPVILGVTVLTSIETGPDRVLEAAVLARKAGLDGVVASAREAGIIRKELGRNFLIVTPGVRPGATEKDDQKRVVTPREALSSGADYIVIGRPVTRAKDPASAIQSIITSM